MKYHSGAWSSFLLTSYEPEQVFSPTCQIGKRAICNYLANRFFALLEPFKAAAPFSKRYLDQFHQQVL